MRLKSFLGISLPAILLIGLMFCAKPTSVADFEGKWLAEEEKGPELTLGADGSGRLVIHVRDGKGHAILFIGSVNVKKDDEQFSISISDPFDPFAKGKGFRLDLSRVDGKTIKLSYDDREGHQEFVLKKARIAQDDAHPGD